MTRAQSSAKNCDLAGCTSRRDSPGPHSPNRPPRTYERGDRVAIHRFAASDAGKLDHHEASYDLDKMGARVSAA
ncbi:hypothetical protein QQ44_13340 [Mycolicibacterium setense]|uniref:Uncharacterized protein n=1 Tax=Mycolicibacterium setense TaxID=431269 RepID=A0ABR4YWS2_9MYCO|nr:hypothetical protein QQ44_13340 [Mycolicibacterium setense]